MLKGTGFMHDEPDPQTVEAEPALSHTPPILET